MNNPSILTHEQLEMAKLRDRITILEVPVCIGEPIITILANEGQWRCEDGRGVIAASDLFQKNPYKEIENLRVELALARQCVEVLKVAWPESRALAEYVYWKKDHP